MRYLLLLLAGAFLCNAIPHLVSGLRGERFFTPWARPRGVGKSSAPENFLWGAANLVIGLALLRGVHAVLLPGGPLAVLVGFIAAGCGLSIIFGKRNEGQGGS